MAGPNRHKRFTVYDMMEAKGVFESNPANADSRGPEGEPLYKGPVRYPKMLYHPEGAEKITVPAEIITTPLGPKAVGEQRELVSRVVQNEAEAKALLAEGWHDHPAKALTAAGKEAPAMSASQRMAELEAEIAKLQAERADRSAQVLAEAKPTGQIAGRLKSGVAQA